MAGQDIFCPSLAALVVPVQNILFLTIHYFNSFVPIAQQAGQLIVLDCLSLNCVSELPPQKKGNKAKPSSQSDSIIIIIWLCVSADEARGYGW